MKIPDPPKICRKAYQTHDDGENLVDVPGTMCGGKRFVLGEVVWDDGTVIVSWICQECSTEAHLSPNAEEKN